ncbi:MAG: DUF4185 domain-containing protein [Desulfomonilia bacterium]|jgi:hypothetical protein|nr:hypothetical protein [Desulfomonilia bacterium]
MTDGRRAMRQGFRARYCVSAFLWVVVCTFLWACGDLGSRHQGLSGLELKAERWHEADQLFRNDDRWLGGDGAYSVDLGAARVLWLFGDSLIGPGYSRDRSGVTVVRNTVAIQRGYNPAQASAAFYWNIEQDSPEPFFRSPGPSWFWPGSGVLVENNLVIFLMEIEAADNELGFDAAGWTAVIVKNPRAEPSRWNIQRLKTPANEFGVIIGSAGSMALDGYLYAFGTQRTDHDAYLVRWTLADAARGDLMHPQWWTGRTGWMDQGLLGHLPGPVLADAQMEFTVHYEKAAARFLEIQTEGFPEGCLVYRRAMSLTGPWSGKKHLYCPHATGDEPVLFYAGKAHPCLEGADLVCTYAANSLNERRVLKGHDLYYPAFVRVSVTDKR